MTLHLISSGLPFFDYVLNGGLARPSTVVLAGIAGAGKSVLGLEVLAGLARANVSCAYIYGEEPLSQIQSRARRLGLDFEPLLASGLLMFLPPNDIARASSFDVVLYDTIQSLHLEPLDLRAPNLRIVLSQLDAEGGIDRWIEDLPDAILWLDYEPGVSEIRKLHCSKNRNGPAPRTVLVELSDKGFREGSTRT